MGQKLLLCLAPSHSKEEENSGDGRGHCQRRSRDRLPHSTKNQGGVLGVHRGDSGGQTGHNHKFRENPGSKSWKRQGKSEQRPYDRLLGASTRFKIGLLLNS